MAHNCLVFTEQAKNINYTDEQRILNESIVKSVGYLSGAQELKNIIKIAISKNHSQDSIQSLKEQLLECFELYFDNLNEFDNFTNKNINI
jgi:hypothetical protein